MFELIADGPPFNIIEVIFKAVCIPMYYGITSLKCIPSTTIGIGHTGYNVVKRNTLKLKISNKRNQIEKLKADNLNIKTDNPNIEPDNSDIETCISDIKTEIEKNIEDDIHEMIDDINKINFIDPTLQDFKDRYNDFMNYIHDIYKIKPVDQDELNQYNGFSIIYVEYEDYQDPSAMPTLESNITDQDPSAMPTLESNITDQDPSAMPTLESNITDQDDIDIIFTTKAPTIIEKIILYSYVDGGAKNKKRTTIKSGHTLLRKTKHMNRNKIYRNKIYRNTKRIRQTKKR
jgi:hypothetical protein